MSDTTKTVLVYTILDRSGSMSATKQQTISGYNEYVNALKSDKETEYFLSLTQFDAPMTSPELTISYENRALADVPELTTEMYQPRGNTPLYDAIGECVWRMDAKNRGMIVLIITDGEENASREFTKAQIKALIAEKEKLGWTFSFIGANIDSYAVGGSVGVAAQNIANYVPGHEKVMFSNLAQATMERSMAYRSVGPQAAAATAFIADDLRAGIEKPKSAHTGGRPAAPPHFPKPALRRDWTVKNG